MSDLTSPELRAALSRRDVRSLTDHELLAGLLSYTVPRGAARLAETLLDTFGTLSGVLTATDEQLKALSLTDHTVCLCRMLLPAYGRALLSEIPRDTVFDSVGKIGDFLTRLFCGDTVEKVYLMLLKENYTLLTCRLVAVGSVNSASLNTRFLVEAALFAGARFAVLAHNHPGGSPSPSPNDIGTTVNLKNAFESIGVSLLEHIVVAGERYAPIILSCDGVCREAPACFYDFPEGSPED